MQTSQRRVRRLKLSGRNEATLASDLNALQDAFNIASFPDVQPNGLLLVRRLDLGLIRPHSNNLGLSRSIDNRIQSLRLQSVCVDEEDAPGHDVVWFSDPAQAVFRLVDLVANNHQTEAWYWTVLFPDFRPEMSLQETLILVSRDFIDTESRVWIMAAVIQKLCAQGRTQKMLASISPSLAQSLLIDSGIDPRRQSPIFTASNSPSPVRPCVAESWQEVIGLSISRWGRGDERTLWMAVNALVIQNPAMVKAGQLLMQDVHEVLDQIDQTISTHRDGFSSYSSGEHADLSAWTSAQDTTQPGGRKEPASASQSSKASQREPDNRQNNAVTMRKTNLHHQHVPIPEVYEEHRQEPVVSAAQKSKRKNDFEQTHSAAPRINTDSDSVPQSLHTGLSFDRQSGFVFLTSLLERLCINDCLALNPQLASINLPARVVRLVAKRMRIESQHPLLLALPEQAAIDKEKITSFVSPALWITLSSPSHGQSVLYRFNIKGAPGRCYIADHSQKLVLYIGARDPSALPEWTRQCQILERPGLHEYSGLNAIENTIQLLISRYLFRYAGIGLRSLFNRNGRIACSRTHLDIIFGFDQLDIRIRKAGLDINPGWVGWLGKVIQFHYESAGRDDA